MKTKVISFNIRCCDDADGNSIAERAPRLARVTQKFDADVIGLQEYRPAWEQYINDIYGDRYDMFSKYRNNTEDIEAAPILWKRDKYECLKTGYFWLSDTPEKESRGWDVICSCYRICTYVILKEKQSGKCFTFMNTHFGFGDDCQVKSARLIFEYSKKISDLPTFVTADFNMTPDSVGYAEMIKNFVDVNAATVNDMSTTFHDYHPETAETLHIDYCFTDKSITPLGQKIITDSVDGKYPSDHFGLYIELDI